MLFSLWLRNKRFFLVDPLNIPFWKSTQMLHLHIAPFLLEILRHEPPVTEMRFVLAASEEKRRPRSAVNLTR